MKSNLKLKFKRAVSVLLAVLMMIMSVPFSSVPADAWFGFGGFGGFGGGWGNAALVTTNYKVEFKDSSFNPVSTVESGSMFYLMISISGNNVWQVPGQKNTYRVYITDNNLLLPNFAGDGFTDGATYSGYTLHVQDDGTRYIEFNIKNGSTKVIRLQAKFKNGTTPDGDTATVKLVNTTTNKSTIGSISAESEVNWSSSKTEDKTQVSGSDIAAGGVTVNYTLSAQPNNAAATKGAWWVTGLQFSDTIALPEGMTFTAEAAGVIKTAVEDAVKSAGYSTTATVTAAAGSSTANIQFSIDSKNTDGGNPPTATAEMSAVNIKFPFELSSTTVDTSNFTTAGNVVNKLTVNARPSGTTTYSKALGDSSVSLKVTVPDPPRFTISKSVAEWKSYYTPGSEVTFNVTVKNVGGTACDITISDADFTGFDVTSVNGTAGNSYTAKAVKPNESIDVTVVGTIATDVADGTGHVIISSATLKKKEMTSSQPKV